VTKIEIFNEDCLSVMDRMIEAGNVVDMIFADLPYKETGNAFDNKLIPTDKVFERFEKLISYQGAIVMTATMKFAVELITHAKHLYKYDWIWAKDNGTNFANTKYQPFRDHELILIFGKGRVSPGKRPPMNYYPQKTEGTPYTQMSGKMGTGHKGGMPNIVTENKDGLRHPKTIQKFIRDKGLHPTQKPVEMLEFLIKSYTKVGDLVFDPTMGSGSTAVAAKQLSRNFIGSEIEGSYFKICEERLNNVIEGSSLDVNHSITKEDNILF
jgi:site-specific DNA-methyltransferase (adenine-specific)